MAFIGYVRPFCKRNQNQLELLNETLTVICTYQLFTFTDFVPDAAARYAQGYVLILTTLLILTINVWVLVNETILEFYRFSKIKVARRKYFKELKRRQKERSTLVYSATLRNSSSNPRCYQNNKMISWT